MADSTRTQREIGLGWHHCTHPCWHRALILFGTLAYFLGGVQLIPRLYAWHVLSGETAIICLFGLIATTLPFACLLIWRCQGRHPDAPRWSIGMGIMWRL